MAVPSERECCEGCEEASSFSVSPLSSDSEETECFEVDGTVSDETPNERMRPPDAVAPPPPVNSPPPVSLLPPSQPPSVGIVKPSPSPSPSRRAISTPILPTKAANGAQSHSYPKSGNQSMLKRARGVPRLELPRGGTELELKLGEFITLHGLIKTQWNREAKDGNLREEQSDDDEVMDIYKVPKFSLALRRAKVVGLAQKVHAQRAVKRGEDSARFSTASYRFGGSKSDMPMEDRKTPIVLVCDTCNKVAASLEEYSHAVVSDLVLHSNQFKRDSTAIRQWLRFRVGASDARHDSEVFSGIGADLRSLEEDLSSVRNHQEKVTDVHCQLKSQLVDLRRKIESLAKQGQNCETEDTKAASTNIVRQAEALDGTNEIAFLWRLQLEQLETRLFETADQTACKLAKTLKTELVADDNSFKAHASCLRRNLTAYSPTTNLRSVSVPLLSESSSSRSDLECGKDNHSECIDTSSSGASSVDGEQPQATSRGDSNSVPPVTLNELLIPTRAAPSPPDPIVEYWLKANGMDRSLPILVAHRIDEDRLFSLQQSDLVEMGLRPLSDCMMLHKLLTEVTTTGDAKKGSWIGCGRIIGRLSHFT